MLPESGIEILSDFEIEEQPTLTYKLDYEKNRIIGKTDELAAMKQLVYLILNTERYQYLIYSWNYGVEFQDLIGQPKSFVLPELERRITDALMQDDRITTVSDFSFETNRHSVTAYFTVNTIFGDLETERTVKI